MSPESLITQKIIDYCKTQQIVMILGKTKSGKVTISRKLAMDTGHELFIADEFIEKYGYENALNQFQIELDHCYHSGKNCIFEGILCYRLLRRLVKEGYYLPNMVIKVDCNDETISHFYNIEEPDKNMNRVRGFNNGLDQILDETIRLLTMQQKKLSILTLNTSIF